MKRIGGRRLASVILIAVSVGLFAISMTGFGTKPAHVQNEFLWKAGQTLVVFWPIYVLILIALVSFFVVGRPKLHTILMVIYGILSLVLLATFGVLLMFA